MIQAIENLRLLYTTNLFQPLPVERLRQQYLDNGGDSRAFAPALRFLRQKGLLIKDDPISCTDLGLRKIQALPIFKDRDASRIFNLKERLNNDSLLPDKRRGSLGENRG